MSDSLTANTAGTTISFDTIPYEILRPQEIIEVAANYRNIGLVGYPSKLLIIGQIGGGNAGTGLPGTVYRLLQSGDAETFWGVGSQMADMVNTVLANNTTTPLFGVALAPPAGAVAAEAEYTFTGNAPATATLPIYVGQVAASLIVNAGDTPSIQAANLEALVNSTVGMPATATAAAGVVTLTARQPGGLGNALRLSVGAPTTNLQYQPGAVPTEVAFTGGAGVPNLSTALAAIATTWFTDCINAFTDDGSAAILSPELERRFAANGRLDMAAYTAVPQTPAQALGATVSNSKFTHTIPAVSQSPPWVWAAALGAVAAFQLANDPARQLRTLALNGVIAPDPLNVPDDDEQEALLRAGFSTFDVQSDGTVTLSRVVSRYTTSPLGIPDPAWRDVMTMKVASRIRYDWASYLGLVWPRAKLADDGSVAAAYDPKIATPRRLWNSWAARCNLYARVGWIENTAATVKASSFVRDPSDKNRVNARQEIDRLGNFMVFAARLEFDV